MDDLRRLTETYISYKKASEELIEKLVEDEEAQTRVERKREHFNSLMEDLVDAVEERIWDLCTMQQSPLPTTCSEELRKWEKFSSGAQVKPGFVPPANHDNECFTPISEVSDANAIAAPNTHDRDAGTTRAKADLRKVITPIKERWVVRPESQSAMAATACGETPKHTLPPLSEQRSPFDLHDESLRTWLSPPKPAVGMPGALST